MIRRKWREGVGGNGVKAKRATMRIEGREGVGGNGVKAKRATMKIEGRKGVGGNGVKRKKVGAEEIKKRTRRVIRKDIGKGMRGWLVGAVNLAQMKEKNVIDDERERAEGERKVLERNKRKMRWRFDRKQDVRGSEIFLKEHSRRVMKSEMSLKDHPPLYRRLWLQVLLKQYAGGTQFDGLTPMFFLFFLA